jgi:hypothetical protein
LGFQPLGPMDVALPLAATQEDSLHAPTKADKATWFIEQDPTHPNRFRIFYRSPIPSTSKCHDQHRVPHQFQVGDKVWLHLQKERLTGPHQSFIHSIMDLTPSPRLWVTMILSSTFPPSLACTQCSMWTSFNLIFHHYWTPQR